MSPKDGRGRWAAWVALAAWMILVSVGCSSGGGGAIGGGGLVISLTPDDPSPGALTVSMAEDSSGGGLITVAVRITGTDNVFAALFKVLHPTSGVEFVSHSAGSLLEGGGQQVAYFVNENTPGELSVDIARLGGGGVDATGTVPVVLLTYRVTAAGSFDLAFQDAVLLDGGPPTPGLITGLSWSAGTLVAQ